MRPRRAATLPLIVIALASLPVVPACRCGRSGAEAGEPAASDASSSASPSALPPSSIAGAGPSGSAPPAPAPTPLQLLRFTFTSGVRGKEPVDVLDAAAPGQRVWAHFAVRNRSGDTRNLAVVFLVNGQKRTSLDLKIDPSWSYRTWSFNTLRKTDTEGEIVLNATEEQGAVLVHARLPIKAKPVTRKSPQKDK
jgi:hypothetical protein